MGWLASHFWLKWILSKYHTLLCSSCTLGGHFFLNKWLTECLPGSALGFTSRAIILSLNSPAIGLFSPQCCTDFLLSLLNGCMHMNLSPGIVLVMCQSVCVSVCACIVGHIQWTAVAFPVQWFTWAAWVTRPKERLWPCMNLLPVTFTAFRVY